jgi:hypothetical protein
VIYLQVTKDGTWPLVVDMPADIYDDPTVYSHQHFLEAPSGTEGILRLFVHESSWLPDLRAHGDVTELTRAQAQAQAEAWYPTEDYG